MLKKSLFIWSFIAELIFSSLLLYITKHFFIKEELFVKSFDNIETDIATLLGGVMFAGSLAFLWTFFSKADTDFYKWLDEKKAFHAYLISSSYTVFVSLLCTGVFIFIKSVKNECTISLAFFVLFLTLINVYTLIKNVIDLMRLNTLFNIQKSNSLEPTNKP